MGPCRAKSGAVSFDLLDTAEGTMHRSSETVAALAAALAKAQAELINPEKIADRRHSNRTGRGGGTDFTTRPSRARCAQDARPA